MSDNNNLPPGWEEADENKIEDSPWEDSALSDDEGDSSEKSEIIPVSNTHLNTKFIIGIAGVVVALAIAFFGGIFVFDMFKNDDGEAANPLSSGVVMGGTTDDGSLGTPDPSDNGQTPTETPTIKPTEEPTSTSEKTPNWQEAYRNVIDGNNENGIVYSDGDNGIVLPDDGGLGEWSDNYYEWEAYTGISLVDFNGNGIPELVIHISGWEWYGCHVYAYENGNVSYSQLGCAYPTFREEATGYYIGFADFMGDLWSNAYTFKNGEFDYNEYYTEVCRNDSLEEHENATIRIGEETYPLKDFEDKYEYDYVSEEYRVFSRWSKEGFVRFEYSYSTDYKTALDEYNNPGGL